MNDPDLLLRETRHRCNNDLQLIVSLLLLQARKAQGVEARVLLGEVAEQVAVLARSRSAIATGLASNVNLALREVGDALAIHAQPRGIMLIQEFCDCAGSVSDDAVTTVALVVNELITNALKHGFPTFEGGTIGIRTGREDGQLLITVHDDGVPFTQGNTNGSGIEITRRLMASIGGSIRFPDQGKRIELRVPLEG